MFDMQVVSQGNNLSRLYGSTATQYINEMLLQGSTPPKFSGSPIPDGKKPGVGKHADGTGKQWQYQQVRERHGSGINHVTQHTGSGTIVTPKPLGPGQTNAFSKVSVFVSRKMKQIIFIHTSIFVSFSPVHTNAFSLDKAYLFMRFRKSSTAKLPSR